MLNFIKVNPNPNRNISFGRAIRPDEVDELTQTSQDAKKYLGMEKLALGIHRSSYPVGSGDLFVGSNMGEEAIKRRVPSDHDLVFGILRLQFVATHGLFLPQRHAKTTTGRSHRLFMEMI